jgi:hypothetical protein
MDRLEAGRRDDVLKGIIEHVDGQAGQNDIQNIFGRWVAASTGRNIEHFPQVDRIDENEGRLTRAENLRRESSPAAGSRRPLMASRAAEVLKIKLRPPVNFWMVNSPAVDYGEDSPVQIRDLRRNSMESMICRKRGRSRTLESNASRRNQSSRSSPFRTAFSSQSSDF